MRDRGPILIPLDGSQLAEGALAYGAAFARALGERVVLITA
ncbi:MAG: universal stress protein, partial [Dehalococcoidia bacterium]